jgi:AraC-like DNA-binding protein
MIQCDTFNGVTLSARPGSLNRNRVTISSLQEVDVEAMSSPTYSIKYALKGTEHYFLNGRRVSVGAGKFLVVNKEQPFGTHFKSARNVTGMCLHLEKTYLHNVYLQLTQTPAWLLDHPSEAFGELHFQELVSSDKENDLGSFLQKLLPKLDITAKKLHVEEEDFFFQLASQLLLSQKVAEAQTASLQVQKSSTKKELLHRLAVAREVIEQEMEGCLDITTLSQKSSLSASHLFRCFKQVYGLSPYQFHLQQRLQKAASLIRSEDLTASEVSYRCGFADLPSFSKAFKKFYGIAPQAYKKIISGPATQLKCV